MTYILYGRMEDLKIEIKRGLVFKPGKEKGSRFWVDLIDQKPRLNPNPTKS